MARLFARRVVVVAGLVLVSGVVRAQTPTQTVVQTPVLTESQLLGKLAQNPDHVGTYLDLAKLYTDLGRLDEAERMLQRAMTALQTQRQQQVQTAGTRALLPLSAELAGALVRIGGAIKEPTQIKYVAPVYPESARKAGVTGVVILELVIDKSGLVREAKVLRPVALLDQAAIDAVKQWQFAPTIYNGEPVPVMMTITVNFAAGDPSAGSGATVSASAPPSNVNAITIAGSAAPNGNQPVRIGGQITEPKKIRDVRPVYPQEALAARAQGVVTIEAVIDRDGNVADTKVVRSAPMLDQAAVDAVRQWKFTPTTINGVPVSVLMTVTVSFNLGI